jgi:hypothetical protein
LVFSFFSHSNIAAAHVITATPAFLPQLQHLHDTVLQCDTTSIPMASARQAGQEEEGGGRGAEPDQEPEQQPAEASPVHPAGRDGEHRMTRLLGA